MTYDSSLLYQSHQIDSPTGLAGVARPPSLRPRAHVVGISYYYYHTITINIIINMTTIIITMTTIMIMDIIIVTSILARARAPRLPMSYRCP